MADKKTDRKRPAPGPRRAPVVAPAVAETPCLVCGKPVSRAGATLCLECIHKAEKSRRPRFAGGARTEHGTRVARAVTCVRCGKEDYLAFKPRDPEKVMCRACTMEVAGRDEHGDLRPVPWVEITCQYCGRKERVTRGHARKLLDPESPEPILCTDCDRGIVSIQGNKTLTGERRKSGVILKRRSAP